MNAVFEGNRAVAAARAGLRCTGCITEREACNVALRQTVAGRPHSNFINYRIDKALTSDHANFIDYIHYRSKIAAKIAAGIIASLRSGKTAQIDF